ncbi:MAG TPA: hypothetical protein VHG10_00010 [Glycomyces sp.]|nr:hypothetical protein [Glycomyces sp.]
MTIDPEDEQVKAVFASLKAESSAHFPPPPVNELIMRGPAAMRRRRLVSLAAVVGACTAVTAGGFAVAQTLGPLAGGPDPAKSDSAAVATSTSDESPSFTLGDPASPESNEGEDPTVDATAPPETTLVLTDPGEYGEACAAGPLGLNGEDWTFTAETPWKIAFMPDDGVGPVPGDVDADGDDDVVAVLECHPADSDETFVVGAAAFAWNEDGTALEQLGWVWETTSVKATAEVAQIEDGVVSVKVDTPNDPDRTGVFRYAWIAETASFAAIVDDVTVEPTPSETSSSPTPAETPTTTEGTVAATSSES